MNGRRFLIGFLTCLVACVWLSAQTPGAQTITAGQAKDHIGETARVCGLVVSPHYSLRTRGRRVLGSIFPNITLLCRIEDDSVKPRAATIAKAGRSHQPGLDPAQNLFPRRTRSFFWC